MKIADLIPTHNRLRKPASLMKLDEINRKFDPPSLSKIDNVYYIHDGHHRLVWMFLNGIKEIFEYKVTEFELQDYNRVSLENKYVTPLDLKNQCRTVDFYTYKEAMIQLIENYSLSSNQVQDLAYKLASYYKEPRTIYTLEQLANESKSFYTGEI